MEFVSYGQVLNACGEKKKSLHPIHSRGIPWGSVHHFKPKRIFTRLHPETNDN
jgi:hypothetical protein